MTYERKPLIYIAGPYTHGDPVTNTRDAVEEGMRIYEATGAGVIVPHLSLLAHVMFPRPLDYWYNFDLAQLIYCDAVYRLDGPSHGADREVAFAEEHGIPVFLDRRALLLWIESGGPS